MYDKTASSLHHHPHPPARPIVQFFFKRKDTFNDGNICGNTWQREGQEEKGRSFFGQKQNNNKNKYHPKNNAPEVGSRAGDSLIKHMIWHLHQMWLNYKTDVRAVQTFKITK